MKLVFLTAGGRWPPWLNALTEDYGQKLKYWFSVEWKILSSSQRTRDQGQIRKLEDDESFLSFIKSDDYVIACDEKGLELSTRKFAAKLEKVLAGGKKRLVVVVGGAYGFDEGVRARADLILSLSPMTTTHHLAMGFIGEQIYRAMTIAKNIQYHNE